MAVIGKARAVKVKFEAFIAVPVHSEELRGRASLRDVSLDQEAWNFIIQLKVKVFAYR